MSNPNGKKGAAKVGVTCSSCGAVRYLLHPNVAGKMCRRCAVAIATSAAVRANTRDALDRFAQFVALTDAGCWEWVGTKQPNGYSTFYFGGRTLRGHRWSYEHFVGTIPASLEIDHLCRNRACVNPAHLEPVTSRENSRRASPTSCVNGHVFSGENTYMHAGKRYCRTCRRARNQARMVTA